MPPTTFGTQAASLLAELPMLDADGYDARRPLIDEHLIEPARVLVDELGERLRDAFAPGLSWKPSIRGSISPLIRDLRFAKDKSMRHNGHLHLTWWDGPVKRGAPTLWLRVGPDGVGFASGIALDPKKIGDWREHVDGPGGDRLAAAVHTVEAAGATADEPDLKRVPAGYDAEHRHAGLLRRKFIQWRYADPSTMPGDASLCDVVVARLSGLAPLHVALTQVPR